MGQTFLPGSPFCPGGPLEPRPLTLLLESIVVRLKGVVGGFIGAEITIVNLYIEFEYSLLIRRNIIEKIHKLT